jgi:hypothetical protein
MVNAGDGPGILCAVIESESGLIIGEIHMLNLLERINSLSSIGEAKKEILLG